MLETIVSGIVEKVLGKLISLASDEVSLAWGVKNDVQQLADTLKTIKVVLLDAEEKQIHDSKLRVWLEKLKEVCYNAEDILDEVEVEDLRKQVVHHQSITRKVCHFFSSSNLVVFRFTLGHKIKEIKKRLAKITADKNDFILTEKIDSNHVIDRERETHSFVRDSNVIGRDKDKEEIIRILLCPSYRNVSVSIIPIVGLGGLGKTTLAKLVYNDEIVGDHFKLKMWVCVSDEFSLKKVLIDIISSATEQKCIQMSLDQLQRKLRDIIRHEKYLLVLDDVWNENEGLWCDLKELLTKCVSGSKIIVTTRSDRVASIMGTISTYKLKGLALNDCLSVFVKYAFKEGQEKQHSKLIEIGKEIVKKCGGIPLAVRALGSLLYSSTSEQEWINVKDNEIWKFIFEIHDLMHDVATSLFQNECLRLKRGSQIACKTYRHLFFHGEVVARNCIASLSNVRSVIFSSTIGDDITISQSFLELLISRFQFLRMLDLYNLGIKVVPKGVGTLKHLRYLELGRNPEIKKLPSSIYKLQNLQLLSLRNCEELKGLTREVKYLISLRVLVLTTMQKHLPSNEIGYLNSLRYLIIRNCSNLEYLCEDIGRLRALRMLIISECPRLISLPRGVRNLSSLEDLRIRSCARLNLDLSTGSDNHAELNSTGPPLRSLEITDLSQLVKLPQWLLQCLTNTLGELFIRGCPELSSLPEDMNRLVSLREVRIEGCLKLTERCKPEAGEDWPKIAHIPNIQLDGAIIKSTEN
ncbi:disease resistance protein RGA2-like [Mangifera indica]|uniref:disease resistance protein RGA2-like n=1 Tax=Mangifera indica TaxID=29780 RepID=UPI001CFB6C9D|nr:disease resistance protein RGA2-like [Mangifera indica]